MERLLTASVERDGAEPVLLCSNTYDEQSRLATHSLGGTAEGSHAELLAYAYNVRGWTLEGIHVPECLQKYTGFSIIN